MTVSPIGNDAEMAARIAAIARHQEEADEATPLQTGGPGGTSGGMDARVTRLEEWSKLAGERFNSIDAKLATLPTKTDLLTMVIATLTVGLTMVGLFVATLSYFGDKAEHAQAERPAASAPQPIVIQIPAQPPPK